MGEKTPIADEVWIALALLHRAQPERLSFSQREILERVRLEALTPELRTGVQWHISLHCVANLKPNPATICMLYKLPDGNYRLYRPGDDRHRDRTGRNHPDPQTLPERYRDLLNWYRTEYCNGIAALKATHPLEALLAMKGVGKEVWKDIDADEFIRSLRRDPADSAARDASSPRAAAPQTH